MKVYPLSQQPAGSTEPLNRSEVVAGRHRSLPLKRARRRQIPDHGWSRRPDAGSVTLETTIVFPAVMLLIFGLLQLGFWYHARNVTQGAAEHAALVGAGYSSSVGEAQAAGLTFVSAAAHGLVRNPSVTVDRSANRITVTVTGAIFRILPVFPSDISQTASLPVERRS